ncbi:MAG: hypothetical protein R6V57_04290 [Vicinamibacterales bacterium]
MIAAATFVSVARIGAVASGLIALQAIGAAQTGVRQVASGQETYALYPATLKTQPRLPSPYRSDGLEVVTARLDRETYALVPVTITPGIAKRPWEAPLAIDGEDFPTLARTGRHSDAELDRTRSITGRSLAEIHELALPGRLSDSGFIAEDEDVLSVLKGDNKLVASLGLTHAELARPLLHVCTLVGELYPDSGAQHNLVVFYGGQQVSLEVSFSRGGQKSIFQDGLEGAWTIKIRRDLSEKERAFLDAAYGRLGAARRASMTERLTEMLTGEMQPFYIYRYGFYEGHTAWRTDPVAISFMFGLRSIEQIEAAFGGQLDHVLTRHFIRPPIRPRPSAASPAT